MKKNDKKVKDEKPKSGKPLKVEIGVRRAPRAASTAPKADTRKIGDLTVDEFRGVLKSWGM